MPKQDKYKYKFSFIMPVYKVEKYLEETVESILAQTLDFEQNCEIIFINDGSPDKSEEICLRYQAQYPKNIKYIKQENSGVSVARNRGLREREGEYVSFLDSDDKISSDTLEKVYDFFLLHNDEIDFVSIKLKYFDSREGDHPLNFKYHTTRVIDIEKEYDTAQLSGGSVFVKSDVFKNSKYRFDKNIKVSEDAKLLTELVLEKMAYGVVSEPVYYYRKRQGSVSATGGSQQNRSWYIDTPNQVYRHLFKYSKNKLGYISRYIQYLVMYDLQWRFRQARQGVLSESELQAYKALLELLLRDIDDEIILMQRNLSVEYKAFILSKKHNKAIGDKIEQIGLSYRYAGQLMDQYNHKDPAVHLELLEVNNNTLTVEGYFNGLVLDGSTVTLLVGGVSYGVKVVDRPLRYIEFLGEVVLKTFCFKVSAPLQPEEPVKFHIVDARKNKQLLPLITHKHTHLNQSIGRAYRVCGEYILIKRPHYLEVLRYSPGRRFIKELKYLVALLQSLKVRSVINRVVYFFLRIFFRGNIWIISDRLNAAGDNGEALFRYINKKKKPIAKVWFAISKNSSDFKRMKQYGRVVDRSSYFYKILFLLSTKIISSHADDFVINAFGPRERNVFDLYRFDYVFLQHGIIHNDLSTWLNRYNKNIALFVTSAKPEYKSITEGQYSYTSHDVRLTGLPRYDVLENNPQGKLILAPTWRHELVGPADGEGGHVYSEGFKDSEYFRFYQRLISDKKVKKVLKANGMQGEFYLHPSLATQIDDFSDNDIFEIKKIPYNYRNALTEGSLMVTDYSSVAFDFAFLKKPVIYAQFDRDTFYLNHMHNPGYFSYDKNGFGPVVLNYESTVEEIIKVINSGNRVGSKYADRAKKFFFKFDRNNSKRVYEAILALDDHK